MIFEKSVAINTIIQINNIIEIYMNATVNEYISYNKANTIDSTNDISPTDK